MYMYLYIFDNTADPDQLASDEAIWLGSTQISTLIEKTSSQLMLQVIQIGEECTEVHKNIQQKRVKIWKTEKYQYGQDMIH